MNPTLIAQSFLCSLVLLLVQPLQAQFLGKPFIQQYTSEIYQASISNSDVFQDQRGLLYVANLEGLMIFDGVKWRLIDIDKGKIANKIASDQENRIYVGSIGSIGYLDVNQKGALLYHSLADSLGGRELGRVTNILPSKQGVFFVSDNYLIRWKDQRLQYWDADGSRFQHGFLLNDQLYIKIIGKNLQVLTDDQLIDVQLNHSFKNQSIVGSTPLSEDKMIFFTYNEGNLWSIDAKKTLKLASSHHQDFFSKAIPFSSTFLSKDPNALIYVGTRNQGLAAVNLSNNSIRHIDTQQGLKSNIVTRINGDNQGGIWAALQEGLARIDPSLQWTYWDKNSGIEGVINDIIRWENQIYVATSNGIFIIGSNNQVIKVEGVESRVFKMQPFNNSLLTTTDRGVVEVTDQKAKVVLELFGTTQMEIINDRLLLISSELNGNWMARIENGKLKFEQYFKDINGFSISLHAPSENEIWQSVKFSGLYLIRKMNDRFVKTKFTLQHGLPDVNEIEIIQHQNRLLFATGNGFYQLNPNPKPDSSDVFIPHYEILPTRIKIKRVTVDSKQNVWLSVIDHQHQHIEKLATKPDGTYQRLVQPFKRLPMQSYSAFYEDPVEKGIVWIAGTSGLYRYDQGAYKDYSASFNTLIRQVAVNDSVIFSGNFKKVTKEHDAPILTNQQNQIPSLSFEFNSISFEFAAASYESPEQNKYSYFLEGNDKEWSSWKKENRKEYNNLKAGKYIFHVKSKNVYDTLGTPISYEFVILPPWYQTAWAYTLFTLFAALFVWLVALVYSYRLRIQRKNLKLLVADRTFEVMQQKREIEKQNDTLKHQYNEILTQRDYIEEKNQELQSQQEEIMAINSKLSDLNHLLEKKVEHRTSKIKETLQKLQKTNSELDTFIYRASHDLKGPISRILGLSTLAKLEDPNDSSVKYLTMIESTVKEMDILLAKLTHVHEVFQTTITPVLIDIPSLMQEVQENIKYHDSERTTQFSFDINDEHKLITDRFLVKLVVDNLIENALIYRKKRSEQAQQITVNTFYQSGYFYLQVKDNGIGIDPERLPFIFDMFYRGSDQSKGSGLGLYIVKLAVDKLNGTINVQSELNNFTIFTVAIPC